MLLVLDLIKKNKIVATYAEWISNKFEPLFNTHKQLFKHQVVGN